MNKKSKEELKRYELFMNDIKDKLTGYLGCGYFVDIRPVTKNNGCVFYGLTITEKDSKIVPTIYLEGFFEKYKMGVRIERIIDEIIQIHDENKVRDSTELGFFTDYKKVKEKLSIRLINREKNKELLSDVPHRIFLDLAIVPSVEAFWINGTLGSVLVHNNHICMWGIKSDELIRDAIENSIKIHPACVKPMSELMKEMMEENGSAQKDVDELFDCANKMIVMTNNSRMHGASVIVYPDLLQKIYESLGGEFYVIPSSIHEVIVVTKQDYMSAQNINMMIEDVNSNELMCEEILSDHVYEYDSASQNLRPVYSSFHAEYMCEMG